MAHPIEERTLASLTLMEEACVETSVHKLVFPLPLMLAETNTHYTSRQRQRLITSSIARGTPGMDEVHFSFCDLTSGLWWSYTPLFERIIQDAPLLFHIDKSSLGVSRIGVATRGMIAHTQKVMPILSSVLVLIGFS